MRELKEVYFTECKTRGVNYEIRKHALMTQKIESQRYVKLPYTASSNKRNSS
jgi:hypothetical protein